MFFFFFKQKTAYEMRISDWSSDVCSSDLKHQEMSELRTSQSVQIGKLQAEISAKVTTITRIEEQLHAAEDIAKEREQALELKLEEKIGRASCRERVCQYV